MVNAVKAKGKTLPLAQILSPKNHMLGLFLGVVLAMSAAPFFSFADDTELYVFESTARTGARPQMLIIFDNSGSMGARVYDVDAPYVKGAGGLDAGNFAKTGKLYYSRGPTNKANLPNPANANEKRQFSGAINGCQSSWQYLNTYGVFTGFFREYRFSGANGTWKELSGANVSNALAIDCFEDIQDSKWRNAAGSSSGLPVDSLGSVSSPVRYSAASGGSNSKTKRNAKAKAALTGFGTGRVITVYTEDYLRWEHGVKNKVTKTRLELAKDAIKNVILTTPGVDFGLSIFNMNGPGDNQRDGGRIIAGIKNMSSKGKIDLLNSVQSITYAQNTPLCETLYEAYRYFSGQSVLFGNDDSDYVSYDRWGRYRGTYKSNRNSPLDPDILKAGIYSSPLKKCQDKAYIVYITDGEPTVDNAANLAIESLTGGVDKHTAKPVSYLSSMSSWMNNHDVNPNEPGIQHVSTFTIGFSEGAASAASLLKKTAAVGGGSYFDATNAKLLQGSLQQAVNKILETNASFTSPAVASNNFNRTQSFEYAYYSMFLPNKGPRWTGNIKKFKVTGSGDIIDQNGKIAIGSDGNIKPEACSYWTPKSICDAGGDGHEVIKGGVLSSLQRASSRTLYSNLSSGMTTFSQHEAAKLAGNSGSLASYMGVDESELTSLFSWAKGLDVDNDKNQKTITTPNSNWRTDIMGDALHSKPLALNFGNKAKPDIRVMVGTNHGFFHMFKDAGSEVSESWAFIPYELLPNLKILRANVPTGVHSVYGIDASPVAYTKMNSSGIEKAWVFFGMRRGGSSYYAIDISNPDSPQFMWKIDANSAGMSELGQSWSTPVVTTIQGGSGEQPVLIFGAGYSPAGKDGAGIGNLDTKGRGVFIVNAEDGKLIHHFGVGGSSGTQIPGITDSIPSSVAVLDANDDGKIDRIYATDTGGNVWRMDLPTADKSTWSAFKFASLGGPSLATNRRFFSGPVVAQTMFNNVSEVEYNVNGVKTTTVTYQNVPYDAVVVGSGHRAMPSDLSRADMFFTLQDRNVTVKSYKPGNTRVKIPEPLTLANLYNVTSKQPKSKEEYISFGTTRGWYYDFGRSGEKNLSSATIINGRVFFTSYVPGNLAESDQCLISGKGYLYNFGLHRGQRDFEYRKINDSVPDTPQMIIPPRDADVDGNHPATNIYLIGIGDAVPNEKTQAGCESGDLKCIGGGLRANKIYYFQN